MPKFRKGECNMQYSLPKDIHAKSYGGFMLVISPSSGNWIVLDSQQQIEILKSLMAGENLTALHERFDPHEIARVTAQIEGRRFVHSVPESFCSEAFTLRLYLTNSCNLRCKHCFMYASSAFDDELTLTEITRLIEACRGYGCVKVILTGGEVMMREDFSDVLKFADSMGIYVQVLTNGTLVSWTDKSIHDLSPYIDEVQVSIDGYDLSQRGKQRRNSRAREFFCSNEDS